MTNLNNSISLQLSNMHLYNNDKYGDWFQVGSTLFTLPFLKPNVQVVFQAILISIQVNNIDKVSLSHSSLAFTTNTSKETVKRATKKLSKLGLLIINPPMKARDPNSYSLPDIDIIFDTINRLNISFIKATKPNEKIPEIKKFVLKNKEIFEKTESDKQYIEEIRNRYKGTR